MLNPITYTEQVIGDFLKYQLTAYSFADTNLYRQMRTLLSLDQTRATPLMRGPYISLSRSFRKGSKVQELVNTGLLHPLIANLAPYPALYGHQETAIRHITAGKTTLISTGTGSGKTECFLYPIISHCLKLRDQKAPEGIAAVLIYPMNALAEDQLGRLRELLTGTGITFGMYIGKTPDREVDVKGYRLPPGASPADYRAKVEEFRKKNQTTAVHPVEERASREEMRRAGKQPRILLTNVKQLELLLTRQQDVELFSGARLDFLVVDEAHTFSGANGAETACLIRRLRAYCGKSAADTVCIATSATLTSAEGGKEAGVQFATRFFGVPKEQVEVVLEEYEPDLWASQRKATPRLPGSPNVHLQNVLEAVTNVEVNPPLSLKILQSTFQALTGVALEIHRWKESLYERLAENEVVYQIAEALTHPRALSDLIQDLEKRLGRPVSEEEVLLWLALGAASNKDGRALLRPIVHAFIRGILGSVVTFPAGSNEPQLWLSAEDAPTGPPHPLFALPVMSCNTCGQHYFEHHVAGFSFTDNLPGGGETAGGQTIWRPLERQNGGDRVVLVDRLAVIDEKEGGGNGGADDGAPRNTNPLHFCRSCGTLHLQPGHRCDGCGSKGALVRLYAVRQKAERTGHLVSCIGCSAVGRTQLGRYREPARPVKASPVSDVHVLAQSMIHRAEHPRLLVFCDNRQDAAFQAGWMQDHARRYRLRALMYEEILKGPLQAGTLVSHLDDLLEADDELSQALLPEVWRAHRKQADLEKHRQDRRLFLRIQVLREIATGTRQRIGLEPWGRIAVDYMGLDDQDPFFIKWAKILGLQPSELMSGVAALLDGIRRQRLLLDRERHIFSRYWEAGDREIQRGYLPHMPGGPKGLKLQRTANDEKERVAQLLSVKGQTTAMKAAVGWGVTKGDVPRFLADLWAMLSDRLEIFAPVTLTGSKGRPLPGCTDVRQVDADRVLLHASRGLYRCSTCRRAQNRPTPHMACPVYRCTGTLAFEEEDPEDYDLMVLDKGFAMLRPREHSAQVPAEDREILERIFKAPGEKINTLVCTPTLELGVDIGALDATLMRNVPPLPSNYWQRAGRAGRRHRMAVNITYARPASHDRAYFADPLKLLRGLISPPRFNLKNDVMIRKHIHAAVLTVFYRLQKDDGALSEADRKELTAALDDSFPANVSHYLFDNRGVLRAGPFDFSAFRTVIAKHGPRLATHVNEVFSQGWPAEDKAAVTGELLTGYIEQMPGQVQEVAARLRKRLDWATSQMRRLDALRAERGTLDPEEDALYGRCDRYIKKLKGVQRRRRREAEGFDDTNTYAVLSAEGFLPGYGLDTGWIVALYEVPPYSADLHDWELRRHPSLALREYIPGNLVYANGHRFIPRVFHLEPVDPVEFLVDVENQAVQELSAAGNGACSVSSSTLKAVPICDVDLPHDSQISDEEDYRFQMGVATYGFEQAHHGGGKQYLWSVRGLSHRAAVRLRLVNVGPAALVRNAGRLGYPVCLVCGQSRSPLASQADLQHFGDDHRSRCRKPVEQIAFYADVIADALALQECRDRQEAFSVMEALRLGAAEILEMEPEDLQVLAVGRPGQTNLDVLLYDPMPGGSGLLDQMVARWSEVIQAAIEMVEDCPSRCQSACVDCMLKYRNSFYHRYLNRQKAATCLRAWGANLVFSNDIPPQLPASAPEEQTVNDAEERLRLMLEKAGLTGYKPQHRIELGRPLGATTPDFYYDSPTDSYEGLCIYLDGMSRRLHGDPARQQADRRIRQELRNRSYEVVEITYAQLFDRDAMRQHFFRIGRFLLGKETALKLRDEPTWFASEDAAEGTGAS
jgi:ATP-dependent helicase YprA (DUF1998 family)